MSRYQRQSVLPEIGEHGQQRLAGARVLVVGAGGLAATLLPLLAGAGVGFIRLYDGDVVELHNLHRQTLFSMTDIGQEKAICAQRALKQRNPDCVVEAIPQTLSVSMLAEAVNDIDLVIDAADNFAITYPLSDFCFSQQIPLVCASVLGRKGYVGGFCGGAPSYRALFPQLPDTSADCNTAGVMGPAVAMLAALQAQMALSILLKFTPSPLGCMCNCDLADWHMRQFRFDNAAEPEKADFAFIDDQQLHDEDCIVDLRSIEEAPVSVTSKVVRILPQQLDNWLPPFNQRIVLVCTSGLRAAKAARLLQQRGFSRLALLADNPSRRRRYNMNYTISTS